MKQKIVIKLPMHSEKDKSKAMQIVVAVEGVSSVSIKKEDEVEVIGEGVDSVNLVKSLRKKFCFADIVSVQQDKKPLISPDRFPPPPYYYPPPPYWGAQVYDTGPPNSCTNM